MEYFKNMISDRYYERDLIIVERVEVHKYTNIRKKM